MAVGGNGLPPSLKGLAGTSMPRWVSSLSIIRTWELLNGGPAVLEEPTADNLDVVGVQWVIRYQELQQVESVELLGVGDDVSKGSGNTMHMRTFSTYRRIHCLRS